MQISCQNGESCASIEGIHTFGPSVEAWQGNWTAIFTSKVTNVDAAYFLGKQVKYAIATKFSWRNHAQLIT